MQLVIARLLHTFLALIGTALLFNNFARASSLSVTSGQPVKLTVTAQGTQPFTYQWRKNGAPISAANSDTYSIASASSADAASYSVVVANSANSTISDEAVLTVNTVTTAAPTITSQPVSITLPIGQTASFSVTASGSGPLSYQWKKSGSAIAGATSATFSLAASTANAGSFSVTVSNSAGSVTSNAAVLAVTAAAASSANIVQASAALMTASASTLVDLTPQTFSARGGNGTDEGIAKLFDGQASTKWLDYSGNTWVQIAFLTATQLQAYSLTSANDAPERDPSSWTLSGSNDGVTWIAIEKRTAQTWSSRLLARDFVLSKPSAAYTKFRFNFQATSGSITQLAELELVGPGAGPASATADFIPLSYSAHGDNGPLEPISQLFDGQAATKWVDFSPTTWVKINLATSRSLLAYSLTSANDHPERDPASWTLLGSNDGVTWTVIEKRSTQSWSSRLLTRDFVLSKPSAAYSHFRFDFQATSGSITQLAELEMSGTP